VPESFKLSLDRTFYIAYTIGIFICLCCPTILQLTLDKIITPIPNLAAETVHNIGYTFTGLIIISTLVVKSRWQRIRSEFSNVDKNQQGHILMRETMLYSMVFVLSSFLGATYYLLGGISVKPFARNFIALTPIMFFIFVPRLHAWRKASMY
jgi:hypothetical protein